MLICLFFVVAGAWGAMGTGASEGGLRRRMPLRRVGGGGVGVGGGSQGGGLPGRAMRYYRLWIYTCNTALLAGALAFAAAAARTLLFDFRRALIPSLTLYQPSFLYAYLALVTQGGALQLLGCVAAVKLSEKLLNAYWLLLLVLLFGDIVLGTSPDSTTQQTMLQLVNFNCRGVLGVQIRTYMSGTEAGVAGTLSARLRYQQRHDSPLGPSPNRRQVLRRERHFHRRQRTTIGEQQQRNNSTMGHPGQLLRRTTPS